MMVHSNWANDVRIAPIMRACIHNLNDFPKVLFLSSIRVIERKRRKAICFSTCHVQNSQCEFLGTRVGIILVHDILRKRIQSCAGGHIRDIFIRSKPRKKLSTLASGAGRVGAGGVLLVAAWRWRAWCPRAPRIWVSKMASVSKWLSYCGIDWLVETAAVLLEGPAGTWSGMCIIQHDSNIIWVSRYRLFLRFLIIRTKDQGRAESISGVVKEESKTSSSAVGDGEVGTWVISKDSGSSS